MLRTFTILALIASPVLATPDQPWFAQGRSGNPPERHERKEERREERRDDHRQAQDHRNERREDRREERRADRPERFHIHEHEGDRDDHRGWDFDHPRHRHAPPTWMNGYWRPGQRHYCALIPGDPSRVYVFLDGRWRLRRVRDAGFRMDLQGANELPECPPPAALPRLGIQFKVVLFD